MTSRPGDGHVKEPYQSVTGLVRGDDLVRAHHVDQVEVQALGAVNADQGYPVGGDVEEFLGSNVLGDPLGGDAGCFQLLEPAGGCFLALVF